MHCVGTFPLSAPVGPAIDLLLWPRISALLQDCLLALLANELSLSDVLWVRVSAL